MTASVQPCRVAIVGASSLRGKELKQILENRSFPADDVRLLDDEAAGILTEAGGEATLIRGLTHDSFEGARFAFFAGEAGFAAQHWDQAHRAGAVVIDLSGALGDVPTAVPWIPGLDATLAPPQPPVGKLFWSPGAAAIAGSTVCAALAKLPVARIAMVFFQPASERGQAGIDELEDQTVKLLAFQPFSREVFDAQVAFNLVVRYGAASRESLAETRAALARAVARYLAGRVPAPAIQLVQAPVFHASVFTALIELSAERRAEEIQSALAAAGIQMDENGEPLGNVSVAGGDFIAVSRVEPDANLQRNFWLWGAADNVRLPALNAVHIAEKVLAS